LANTWTGDGLVPLTLNVTLVVAWISVEGIFPLTPGAEQDDHNGLLGGARSRARQVITRCNIGADDRDAERLTWLPTAILRPRFV
jgi:hypothetical protein